MNTLKKVIFPFFSLFLGYSSVELMLSLSASEPSDFNTIEFLTIAFLFTLYVTGVFAFLGFAYPTSKVLPDTYYRIHKPKTLTSISKILGVKYFQLLLLFTFWGRKSNRKKYFNGTKAGLQNFVYQTHQSEFGHLGGMIAIGISSLILLLHHYYSLVFIISLLNILGNLYPIILQRTHRIRIDKITM